MGMLIYDPVRAVPVLMRRIPVAILLIGMATLSGCNTTKATADSIVKFSSSTSPESMFTGDGVVAAHQQVPLFTAVVGDNLQEDSARGRGEYVASLGMLLGVPVDQQERFARRVQERYGRMFPDDVPDRQAALSILRDEIAALHREVAARSGETAGSITPNHQK